MPVKKRQKKLFNQFLASRSNSKYNMESAVVCLLLFLSISLVDGGLTSDSTSEFYDGAIVTFNYTKNGISHVRDATADNGAYGAHSPVKSTSGVVIHALVKSTGINNGCQNNYNPVNVSGPWIALVARGECPFLDKINSAAAANASAILVYDFPGEQSPTVMSHKDSADIVAVMITYELGAWIIGKIDQGIPVTTYIIPGLKHPHEGNGLQKTSIIFVAVSFMILMLVSLAWLVFYYIQRFRLIQAHNRGQRHRRSMTRKAISKIVCRTVKAGDEALAGDALCAVCIEAYKIAEVVRKLPCAHFFHKKCIDPWLESRQTCPMCKFNVIKALCVDEGNRDSNTSDHEESIVRTVTVESTREIVPDEVEPEQPHFSGSNSSSVEGTELAPVKV